MNLRKLGFALNPEIQSLPLKHGLSVVILKKMEVFTEFLSLGETQILKSVSRGGQHLASAQLFIFRLLAVWSAHAQFKVNQGLKGTFVQIWGVSPSLLSNFLDASLQLQPISSRSQLQISGLDRDACASCLNSKCFLPWELGGFLKDKNSTDI